jgi:MFS family permease
MSKKKTPWNKKNTRKLVILKLLRNMMLIIPVITLFYTEAGLSLTQIMLLQSIYSMALFALEVPTWYISDRYGRKHSIAIGYTIVMLWYLTYRWSNGFGAFVIAEIILAFGAACISGSDSALLYDTLKQWGKAEAAKKWEWRMSFAGDAAGIVAGIIGWLIGAYYGMDMLWLMSAMILWAGLPLAWSLEEVRHPSHADQTYHILNDSKQVISVFHRNPYIFWLVLYTWVIAYSTYSLVRSQQQRLEHLGAPVARFGILRWVARVFVAWWGILSHHYDEYFGRDWWLLLFLWWIIAGFVLLSLGTHWLIAFLGICIAFGVRGLQSWLSTVYVNQQIDGSLRATTLSSMSMIHRIIFAVALPLQWWIWDYFWLQTMFVVMIGVFLIIWGFIQWKLYQTNKKSTLK